MRAQTWSVLAEALADINYTRDPLPDGYKRFILDIDEPENYAVLYIYTYNPNTYKPGKMRMTRHEFVVPVATYNRDTWIRWVFDNIAAIEHHETCESFQVDGQRIYGPHHGNGEDPYKFWPNVDRMLDKKSKSPGDD